LEALGAYKGISSESQQAVKDSWVREFMAIALATNIVLIKAKVCLSKTTLQLQKIIIYYIS